MIFSDEALGLSYEKKDDHIVIMEGKHSLEYANIPEKIDGLKVKGIHKKAFLGCKLLKEVMVPDSVEEIGDFAFAMCDHLSRVRFPKKELKLGQSLFKNDEELEQIVIGDDEKPSRLLAAATREMSADYLIDTLYAGDADWYKMWDQKLIDLNGRKDDEGYHLYVLCGEEDLHFDYDQYIDYVQERKSGLCMLRLLNNTFLSEDIKNDFIRYLKEHCNLAEADTNQFGQRIEHYNVNNTNPVFNYLIKKHGNDEIYYELLVNEGIITKDNQEELLLMLGDRYPQSKAYIINAFKDDGGSDFFDDLAL